MKTNMIAKGFITRCLPLPLWLSCFLMTACQTGGILQPDRVHAREDISAAETFAVEPIRGGNRSIPLSPAALEHATRQAIIHEMTLKGYRLETADQPADLVLSPRWVVTQVENPMWRNGVGNVDTLTGIPSTIPAATLRISVDLDGQTLWRGDSGWPLMLDTFSIARLEQSVHLALGSLPDQAASAAAVIVDH